MKEVRYTTVDRILAKFHRDLKGTQINEADAIEWIGEAMDFLRVKGTNKEVVCFLTVENFQTCLPVGFQMILQIAKNNCSVTNTEVCEVFKEEVEEEVVEEESCEVEHSLLPYEPMQLPIGYTSFVSNSNYQQCFTPVRLSNNSFFNSVVHKEKNYSSIYQSCIDEYTIVGDYEKYLRFNFQNGVIAVSMLVTRLDEKTGYPLVPEQISFITAITYYLKFKIAEWKVWNGREGFTGIMQDSEKKWLKYASQAKSYAMMPKSIDQHQNMLESTHHLIPNLNRYYGFFGKLGRPEQRTFNDPDNRLRHG